MASAKHLSKKTQTRIVLGLGFVLAGALAYVHTVAPSTPRPVAEIVTGLSPARYIEDVTYLASDEMKGRGDGSPELDKAADYVADGFRKAGLKPAGDNNSYFQTFEITTGAELGEKNALEIAGRALKRGEDFVPMVFSSTAEFEGPLVFAGYGMTNTDAHYDDYTGIDVAGKIAVVLMHNDIDPKSPFAATSFAPQLSFVNKAINAKLHGARGIIFISASAGLSGDELGPAPRQQEESDMGIPAVHAKRAPLIDAFKAAGKDLGAVEEKIDKNFMPQSFELSNAKARISTEILRSKKMIRNVVAAIEGSDPKLKDEWIVVGAHYDHLGLGNRNSLAPSQIGQVHHGADDNASGTAGVIELARIAAENRKEWKRSVLFVAFAGEEIGLLGSSYFVNHPSVPVKDIDAMINMDMIGRLNNDRLYVGGVGTSPTLKPTLQELDKGPRLELEFSESGYGSSDHMSFNAKKIPVLFFFSGLHTDYHKPSDTADKINAMGAVRVLSLVYATMDRLAADPKRLDYVEVQQPQAQAGRERGYGPYFGSVPDFRDDIKGVLFSDVQNNSPAAKAGLKAGDLMVEFDGKTIERLNDYAFALRSKKPGDIVAVVVKRNGEDIHANVTLEARR
jgi:hypothetical protein